MEEEIIEYKIYQIVCNETGEVYFGKTTKTLEERLRHHKNGLNCTSKQIIERDDYYIERIDLTFDEEECVMLERFYIETFECVNQVIPGRTKQEYREDNKDEIKIYNKKYYEEHKEKLREGKKEYLKKYYDENKEIISEKGKEKYQKNKDEILARNKKYREEHKDEISARKKKIYQKNKEKISEKSKEKYTCVCGSNIRKSEKSCHEKSKKHIKYINSLK
jgi:hypothetical protein